ncbi:MAG TPA: hypothetical protein VN429_10430 [Methanospirillum sp.]|uniref:hypothetical protein n=1 Tax=Methanospirillum sp. TaxID=45200 RepID=UPI002B6A560B|nr:hypothetical protein [Methanospirillum sp.]HWQ64821.1 hypothetical protein [Methanospirillum sp.]
MGEIHMRFMINFVHGPVNPEAKIGNFRKDIYIGLRIPGTLTVDEQTKRSLEKAMKAGCKIELWSEKILVEIEDILSETSLKENEKEIVKKTTIRFTNALKFFAEVGNGQV